MPTMLSCQQTKMAVTSSPPVEKSNAEIGFKTLAAYLACRKIIGDDKLDKKAVTAQKEEEERMKRLAERAQASLTVPPNSSHLKSLLTGMYGCSSKINFQSVLNYASFLIEN